MAEGRRTSTPARHCVTVTSTASTPTPATRTGSRPGPRSPTGRTRTLPAAGGPVPHRRGVLRRLLARSLTAYRAAADADVDLVLHLGDYIYEDAGQARHVAQRAPPTTRSRSTTTAGATPRSGPTPTSWPCTSAIPSWPSGTTTTSPTTPGAHGAKHHDPNEHGPWEDRLRRRGPGPPGVAAGPAHRPRRPAPGVPLVHRRRPGRGGAHGHPHRRPRPPGRRRGVADLRRPGRSLLGDDQRAWAHDRARRHDPALVPLVSGVVLNRMELPVERAPLLGEPGAQRLRRHRRAGHVHDDEWDGYPAERDAGARSPSGAPGA